MFCKLLKSQKWWMELDKVYKVSILSITKGRLNYNYVSLCLWPLGVSVTHSKTWRVNWVDVI